VAAPSNTQHRNRKPKSSKVADDRFNDLATLEVVS
jgi:hypothetical protein